MVAFRNQYRAIMGGTDQGVDWIAGLLQRGVGICIDSLIGIALWLVNLIEIYFLKIGL
jgi:hypothetical protein